MSTVRSAYLVAVMFALAVLATFVPSADATLLNPNSCVGAGTATCPGTLDIFNGDPVVLLASTSQPVNPLSGTYSGTLLSAVYRDTARGNLLDFYFQFSNSATCPNPSGGGCDGVTRLTAFNFTGTATDVGYRTDFNVNGFVVGSKPPLAADRDSGSTVGFNFFDVNNPNPATRILPGDASNVLVIRTDATNFTTGFASVIDGGATTVFSFQPIPPQQVPEPGTLLLLGAGIAAGRIGLRRRR